MRIPISWLREYADLPASSDEIAERLAMLGFPVEEIVRRPAITNIVIAKVTRVERHPNADRLFVCTIDAGDATPLTIATAATNVSAGQTVPVARIGARLPHVTIERRTMRGVASEGMLCSPDELALPPEWFEADGIMQLDDAWVAGGDAIALLGLGDDVLDVEITSNRVDAMSALGLARELAASYGVALRLPSFKNPGTAESRPRASVDLQTPDCSRFVAQRFDDVRVGAAPARVRVRLALCGVRPISNVVDVSNYVMLETGQPLHFYDAQRVKDAHLVVRDAREGERLVTLDGVERALSPVAMVIADAHAPLGLAGVMGGTSSEVGPRTTSVLLESATFFGPRVRRTAQLTGLRTEASSRHERAVPPALADVAAARAAQMLVELGASAYAPVVAGTQEERRAITVTTRDVTRLLGLQIPADRIARHLSALGCTVTNEKDALTIVPPPWRGDLTIAADVIEEVARIEGYDAIEPVVPAVPSHDISSAEYARETLAARTMAALGYRETITHSLQSAHGEQSVELRNPLSEEQRYLRTDLALALLANVARAGYPYRLFEIGHVFAREGDVVAETPVLGLAVAGERTDEPAWHDSEFLRVKGDVEALVREMTGYEASVVPAERDGLHPGKTAALVIGGAMVGVLGRVDPRLERALDSSLPLYSASVRLDRLPEMLQPAYRPPSRFPSTYRDLALSVVAEVSAESVEATTAQAIGDICTAVRVFDEYRGPQVERGRKSLAVRATMRRFDGTITDDEADAAIARAVEALNKRLGASIRV